jgi:hypothetical protein
LPSCAIRCLTAICAASASSASRPWPISQRPICTIEEREEYELHIAAGNIVFVGVDYGAILRIAESADDIIGWNGGNNAITTFPLSSRNFTSLSSMRFAPTRSHPSSLRSGRPHGG